MEPDESGTHLPCKLVIIDPSRGTRTPFDGHFKELTTKEPKYEKAQVILHADASGLTLEVYEPPHKAPRP